MRVIILGFMLISVIAATLGCVTPSALVLDDSYDAAIERAVQPFGQSEKQGYLRKIFQESIHAWNTQSSYAQVRSEVAAISGVRNQFRLEVGSVNAGGYRVIWIVETRAGVVAFSNMFSARHLTTQRISKAEWRRFVTTLGENEKSIGCISDLSVDDGSAYFGTIASGQEVKKFAVYGFLPFPRAPAAQDLYARLSPCSEIIWAAYSLVRSAHLS